MDKEHYLWGVSRYIEQNPVRAGLVERVEEYEWSSARNHILCESNSILIGDNWLDEKQRKDYIEFVKSRDREGEKIIRQTTKTGRPLGVSDFLDKMEALLCLQLRLKRRGRPSNKRE